MTTLAVCDRDTIRTCNLHPIDDWSHAVQIDAKCAEGYRLRGMARALRNDDAKAIEDLTQFLALAPESSWAGVARGKLTQLRARNR